MAKTVTADEIREYVLIAYILPARRRGKRQLPSKLLIFITVWG